MSRADERVQAQRPVSVSCESWADFIDLYTRDISHGGMFIASPTAPALYTKVSLKMQLPGDVAQLTLIGEVVRVVPPERATRKGQRAGFGIRFGDLDDDTRQALAMLMQHAQGQTGDDDDGFRIEGADEERDKPEPIATGDEYKVIMELREELARVKEQDEFDILELELDATVKDVRAAFFELTKQWHPDKFQRGGAEVKSLATQVFIGIKKAYQTLSRPKLLEEQRAARIARLDRAQAHQRSREEAGIPVSTERAPSRPPTADRVNLPTERPPAPPPKGTPVRMRASDATPPPPPKSSTPAREPVTASFDQPVLPTTPPPPREPPPREPPKPEPSRARTRATPSAETPATTAPPEPEPAAAAPEPKRPRKRRRPSPLARKMMRQVFEQTSAASAGAPARVARDPTPTPTMPRSHGRRAPKAADKDTLEADARVSKAAAFMKQHRLADAIAALREALEFKPEHVRAQVLLGLAEARTAAQAGRRDEALAKYQSVLAVDPENPDAMQELETLAAQPQDDKPRGLFSRILTRES